MQSKPKDTTTDTELEHQLRSKSMSIYHFIEKRIHIELGNEA